MHRSFRFHDLTPLQKAKFYILKARKALVSICIYGICCFIYRETDGTIDETRMILRAQE